MPNPIKMQQIEEILTERFGTTSHNVVLPKLDITWDAGMYLYKGKYYEDPFDPLWFALKGDDAEDIQPFFFCTTPTVEGRPAEEVFGLISADCVYGMNFFRDIFASVRDLVGGRSAASENVLRDAKITVQHEMTQQAIEMGANAIVGVDFDFNEISGGGKSGMLLVSGTGTAVKLKDTD